jgi:hypothetical protein
VKPFDDIPDDQLKRVGFAEVFWADIPQGVVDEKRTMEETKDWARTVVARAQRLYERNYPDGGSPPATDKTKALPNGQAKVNGETPAKEDAKAQEQKPGEGTIVPPDFGLASEVLDEIIDTVYVMENLSWLSEKAGLFSFDVREVMDEYLGDVQMVAEFSHYRMDIVGRFHAAMQAIWEENKNAEIHIVAHSEGSVVAFLGLMNALFGKRMYPLTKDGGPSVEQEQDSKKNPKPLEWLANVKGLMTIGSPIDKHYLLWPKLFDGSDGFDLRKCKDLMEAGGLKANQIKWRNYYDLADPVGYKLETIRLWLRGGGHRTLPTRTARVGWEEYKAEAMVLGRSIREGCRRVLRKRGALEDVKTRRTRLLKELGRPEGVPEKRAQRQVESDRLCKLFQFRAHHDIGFTRYLLPGKAHNDYWEDAELFNHFICEVIQRPEKEVPKAPRPGDRPWVGRISFCLPFVLSGLLLSLASYILLRGILCFYLPAVAPIDHYMRLMLLGYSPTTMEYTWGFAMKEFGGWALMLAGTTLGSRVRRLGGWPGFWVPVSVLIVIAGARLVNGEMISAFAGSKFPGETLQWGARGALCVLCLAVMYASNAMGVSRRSPWERRTKEGSGSHDGKPRRDDDARQRRLRWVRKGARPLVLLGALSTFVLAALPGCVERTAREKLGTAVSAKFIYWQGKEGKFKDNVYPEPCEAEGEKLIELIAPECKEEEGHSMPALKNPGPGWAAGVYQAAAAARQKHGEKGDVAWENFGKNMKDEQMYGVLKNVSEDYQNFVKVLKVGPPVWPLILSWLAFCYTWWLSILIFDLAYVWNRYVRHGTAIDRMGVWMDEEWRKRAERGE